MKTKRAYSDKLWRDLAKALATEKKVKELAKKHNRSEAAIRLALNWMMTPTRRIRATRNDAYFETMIDVCKRYQVLKCSGTRRPKNAP